MLADRISDLYGLLLYLKPRSGCRILMYHSLKRNLQNNKYNIYNLDPNVFESQIKLLQHFPKNNLKNNVVPLIEGVSKGEGFVISFDDGYLDTLSTAAPILNKYKFPFVVFISPKAIIDNNRNYLSVSNLKELASLPGITIGAHGFSHCRLTKCDDRKLELELVKSKQWLEDTLSVSIKTMSYPYGAFDNRVREAVLKAGYDLALSSRFGVYRLEDDNLTISRTDIWAQDTNNRFIKKLSGNWDWLRYIS